MKIVLVVVAALVAVVVLVALVGSLLPRGHVASCRSRLGKPPEAVWAVIADHQGAAAWRPDLRSVEQLPDRDGRPVYREHGRHGAMTLEVVESKPPGRLVTRIADPDLPFGGSWTFEVAPDSGGSVVTVTEDGFVKNPIFRFLARFVVGYHGTMRQYLAALGRKLGEDVVPERVR
jgi:uncharacterized protein YndB with AHSA1/START domain